MKLLYLECNMGAAGDMLMAALLELLPDRQAFLDKMNALGLPGVRVTQEHVEKCGILGTHISVLVDGEEESCTAHVHTDHGEAVHAHESHTHEGHTHEDHTHDVHAHLGLRDAAHMLSHLNLSEKVRADALAVYDLLAEAESAVHGKPVEQIHFHELGTLDAMADVVGVCVLMDMLSPDVVLCSPVHVGFGEVHCAHGVLPVPAPATALLLRDVPIYGGTVRGELCTPTGAALLKYFTNAFGDMPVMRVKRIGYGMGKKDFDTANCLRAMWGETMASTDAAVELCCNLDDMTPEALGYAQERLWEGGALDVYTTPIGMKKNRPGVLLTCLCREEEREAMLRLLFQHTTTLGVRARACARYTLERETRAIQTKYGAVRVKRSSGYGVCREKPEYEDMARAAKDTGESFLEIEKQIRRQINEI